MKASEPSVTSLISNGRRRLVYTYEDGKQMVEEYDMKTHEIINRKIKKPSTFKESKWEYEIGDGFEKKQDQPIIMKSSTTPIFVRKDGLQEFQWRIRNLPYPIQTYQLQIDGAKQEIVIRTTNKKYYKRFDIPDMKRMNIKLNKDSLSYSHKNQALIVCYRKPQQILSKQIKMRKQFDKLNLKKPKQGDFECSTQ